MTIDSARCAYFSGLLQGWSSRLEFSSTSNEIKSVVKDMKTESIRLAKIAGVNIDTNL